MRVLLVSMLAAGVVAAAAPARAADVYIDNVVIVLDASGSMNKTMDGTNVRKIDAAKQALRQVLKGLPASTQVGLLAFGGSANGWVYPLGPRDDARLLPAINGLSVGGGTPLGEFMQRAANRLLEARKAQYGYGSYRLLIVTDGEASDAPLMEAVAPEILSRGITMDVIGVSMAKAHTLAKRAHSYRAADDPAALTRAVQEVFAEVGGRSDDGTATAFDELSGLSAEVAMCMISALSSSGNQPIGETVAGPAAPAGSAPNAGGGRAPSPPPPRRSSRGKSPAQTFIMIVVAIIVLNTVFKGRRGGGRGRRR